MKKLSFNNKKTKISLIVLTIISCLIGVVGAFFKVQPVYYAGMTSMAIMLIVTIVAFANAAKEDKVEEINERYEEAKKFAVTEEEYKAQQDPEQFNNEQF